MAGNIPLVGFHDFLSVLIAGQSVLVKLSSKDSVLIQFITEKLIELEPAFTRKITFAEQLKNFDAVIATGSDNSSRYITTLKSIRTLYVRTELQWLFLTETKARKTW